MAAKSKLHGLNGMHTAGIFSDMTVDGPEIGTLVVIVDRAKNLPNRKTIGKQDPYCAARLGKEAKKTETDRRGGQTPRWDQELRYTVHDSSDYFQLKVSVFNDDKKTDLIGETWIDLKEVIIPGGGQNDLWHTLSCKGKYAGEIRIEITYYDTRPKQEKPAKVKEATANIVEEGSKDTLKGPRQAKAAVKRRPLPSDPITGEPAPAPTPPAAAPPAPAPAPVPVPAAIPDHVQTPPRGYPPSPTVTEEHSQTPSRSYHQPSTIPDHVQAPPRGYPPSPTVVSEHSQSSSRGYQPPSAIPDHVQTPPRGYQGSQSAIPDHGQTPARGFQGAPNGIPDHVQTPPRGYQAPPTAIPEHVHTPQRGHQNSSYIPNQSPLQNVEYNTPSPRFNNSQGYESPNGYGPPPGSMAVTPTTHQMPGDRYEIYDPASRNDYSQGNRRDRYQEEEHVDPRDQYVPHDNGYDDAHLDDFNTPPSPGGPPPPPPAHRSRNGSHNVSPAPPAPVLTHHNSYGPPSDSRSTNSYNIPPGHDTHRHSIPTYPQRQQYQAYSPERDPEQFRGSGNGNYGRSPGHQSYDSHYGHDHISMQPTVEDAPPSPGGSHSGLRGHGRRNSQYTDPRYEKDPSPAPLNVNGRGSSSSGRNSISKGPSHQYSNSSMEYSPSNSQLSLRDQSTTAESIPSRNSYNSAPLQPQTRRSHSANEMADLYGLPEIPSTLVAGMDPVIAQEISERIYDERRGSFGQTNGNSSRGRYQNSSQYQQNQPSSHSYHENSGAPFVPAASSYDERQSRFSTAIVPVVKPRPISPDYRYGNRGTSPTPGYDNRSPSPNPGYGNRGTSPNPGYGNRGTSPNPGYGNRGSSPNPRSATTRKSVSPSPGASDDKRRLSGIPFGPDSYNALNPTISDSPSTTSLSAAYDTKAIDPDAKIITHDGREVDPSDHIPESNYAPLLESKGPKYASQLPDRNYRPPPNSSQAISATGRRPLKQAGRPQSMAVSSPIYMNNNSYESSTPPTARNRLQKKTNRMSAQPAPSSSPLAPLPSYNDNGFTPKSLVRASTMDYNSSENYAPPPQYSSSPNYGGPPPLPAKVPLAITGPPSQSDGGDHWALIEEMKSIDLGTGRARRRGY